MERAVEERAFAKLNISLDVGARRSDGYHEMTMVMQTVSLCDELRISLDGSGGVRAETGLRFIPCDDRNLAVRAALRYLEAIGEPVSGVKIEIKKRIPVGAGMAGGSADAAAVLRGMNRLYGQRLKREELEKVATRVGSDVAFCVCGGTSLARGRGEVLTALPPMPECHLVICKPEFSISTPELFRKLDGMTLRTHPDTAGIIAALERGELTEICRRMYNVFEDVDDRRMRTVAEIKGRLLDLGAMGAVMTGTGSAVFGIYAGETAAAEAEAALSREYKFCCIARPRGAV